MAIRHKLFALNGTPMLVDTGNEKVDHLLSGYVNVITGFKENPTYRISA